MSQNLLSIEPLLSGREQWINTTKIHSAIKRTYRIIETAEHAEDGCRISMDVTVVTVIRKVLETQSDSSHRSAHTDEQRNETSILNKVSHVIIISDEARVYLFMRTKTFAIERSPKAP
jgi:hypothetical protein